jgi:hypothetical protein
MIRTGDIVRHGPTAEEWTVAYVRGEYLAWCGWPPGEARLADCTLVRSCSDDEYVKLLRRFAALRPDRDYDRDRRQRYAEAKLKELSDAG